VNVHLSYNDILVYFLFLENINLCSETDKYFYKYILKIIFSFKFFLIIFAPLVEKMKIVVVIKIIIRQAKNSFQD